VEAAFIIVSGLNLLTSR